MADFGDSFMDFAHGWNRYVTGGYHEAVGGAKVWWNGGTGDIAPGCDTDDQMLKRAEGADEYWEGEDWARQGKGLMGKGVRGMLGMDDEYGVCTEDGDFGDGMPESGESAYNAADWGGDSDSEGGESDDYG